jgi:putative flippase GtrA
VIEFTVLRILVGYYNVTPFIAYAPAKILPVLFVFFFNKYVTFRAAAGDGKQHAKRFILVYSFGFCASYLLASSFYFIGMHTIVGFSAYGLTLTDDRTAYVANLGAIALMSILNYCLSQKFIFRSEVPVAI